MAAYCIRDPISKSDEGHIALFMLPLRVQGEDQLQR